MQGHGMQPQPDSNNRQQRRQYLSPREFSLQSGLSLATVHRYLKKHKLPFRQPGGPRGRILIPDDALKAVTNLGPLPVGEIPDAAVVALSDQASVLEPVPLPGPRPGWIQKIKVAHTKEM
jgi:hypothetical protein